MTFTAVPNTPAITLSPTGTMVPALTPAYSQCDPLNGNYAPATGRDLFSFYLFPSAEFAPSWVATSNYSLGAVVNFAAVVATITSVQETSGNILTITAVNTFTIGVPVTLIGLSTATFLNGVTVTVTSSSGTAFTAIDPTAHGIYGPTADTGSATAAAGTFIAKASSGPGFPPQLAQMPGTTTYWATYVDTDANLTIYSAPDACTGRKSDIDDYNVPLAAQVVSPPLTGPVVEVEFLVLPSSVFTQASGQIQFLASCNLIYVYVRSL